MKDDGMGGWAERDDPGPPLESLPRPVPHRVYFQDRRAHIPFAGHREPPTEMRTFPSREGSHHFD